MEQLKKEFGMTNDEMNEIKKMYKRKIRKENKEIEDSVQLAKIIVTETRKLFKNKEKLREYILSVRNNENLDSSDSDEVFIIDGEKIIPVDSSSNIVFTSSNFGKNSNDVHSFGKTVCRFIKKCIKFKCKMPLSPF